MRSYHVISEIFFNVFIVFITIYWMKWYFRTSVLLEDVGIRGVRVHNWYIGFVYGVFYQLYMYVTSLLLVAVTCSERNSLNCFSLIGMLCISYHGYGRFYKHCNFVNLLSFGNLFSVDEHMMCWTSIVYCMCGVCICHRMLC